MLTLKAAEGSIFIPYHLCSFIVHRSRCDFEARRYGGPVVLPLLRRLDRRGVRRRAFSRH
jgi:hypothetical protein